MINTRIVSVRSIVVSLILLTGGVEATSSTDLSVTLTNSGNTPVNISAITASKGFVGSDDCSNLLAVGSSCQVSVQIESTETGSLVIEGNLDNTSSDVITGDDSITEPPSSNNHNISGAEFYLDFDDFAAGTVLTSAQIQNMFSTTKNVRNSSSPGATIVPDPANSGHGNVFRMFFPKGTSGREAGGQWVSKISAADEYYFAYDIYVPADFNFPLSSKMPGLFGGDMSAASGNAVMNGVDGFSVFQGHISEKKSGDTTGWSNIGDGNLIASTYTYNKPRRLRRYNYALTDSWKSGTSAQLSPGRWVRLEQHVKLNDATAKVGVGVKANGVYEVWLDGVQVYYADNLIYRQTSDLKTDGIFFIWWYGGGGDAYNAREDQYMYFDNFIVSTQPISH
jgi:hypothetical protein